MSDLQHAIDAARARLDPTSGDRAEIGLLRAEVARLTAERDEAQERAERLRTDVLWYLNKAASDAAEIKALRAALEGDDG